MKLYNTLTRRTEEFTAIHDTVRMYSCGPTVYDYIHIGNLSAFIAADTLRRVLTASGYEVTHVMNFTDIDDKTIRRSAEDYPELEPMAALTKLTDQFKQEFLKDMVLIGNDVDSMKFVSAVDSIEGIRALITELYNDGFAYITDDGVYFSINNYQTSGKKYGQLTEINAQNTSESRIDNDEYDKDSIQDFALWKKKKPGEPAWPFELNDQILDGRPGWHIECSVMSVNELGQPFDIHTGGIDLIFPHHENEIAQSTAGKGDIYAKFFVHNEHLLVDGKKMAKSAKNFFTVKDISAKGITPLAFRLLVLQSHYHRQSNFTWENLMAAANRLVNLRKVAVMVWQATTSPNAINSEQLKKLQDKILSKLQDNLNTPEALAELSKITDQIIDNGVAEEAKDTYTQFIDWLDSVFGLDLTTASDVDDSTKALLKERSIARESKDWQKSDELRQELEESGIAVRDTPHGQFWSRIN